MKRRNFIGFLGGAVAFPFATHAQQDRGVRRIAVLQPFAIDSPEKPRVEAFVQELQRLGWTDGRNLQIEYRWETSDLRKAFTQVADPVSAGFVDSLAKPGGNVTGFTVFEYEIGVARTAQGNCTQPGAGRGHQRSQREREYWPACCDSVRWAFVQGGGEPTRWTRWQRH